MVNETALVTGSSSGIGLELAKLFAADKSDLVLIARNEGKLQTLADEFRRKHGIRVWVLAKDLATHEASHEVYDQLQADGIEIDVLVNNAGFGALGKVVELDIQRQIDMIQVNVTALTHLTCLFLPRMIERGRGGILNVSSTAAFQPGPNMAVYYATKAYVLSFTEALAEELSSTGVKVSCLAPGPTETGFGADSGMESSPLFKFSAVTTPPHQCGGFSGYACRNRRR